MAVASSETKRPLTIEEALAATILTADTAKEILNSPVGREFYTRTLEEFQEFLKWVLSDDFDPEKVAEKRLNLKAGMKSIDWIREIINNGETSRQALEMELEGDE